LKIKAQEAEEESKKKLSVLVEKVDELAKEKLVLNEEIKEKE